MNIRHLRCAAGILVLFLLAAPGAWAQDARKTLGDPAPDFSVRTLDGSTFSLADHKGNVVLVWFWGTY